MITGSPGFSAFIGNFGRKSFMTVMMLCGSTMRCFFNVTIRACSTSTRCAFGSLAIFLASARANAMSKINLIHADRNAVVGIGREDLAHFRRVFRPIIVQEVSTRRPVGRYSA
jgi:hypothetical protein